MLHGVGLFHRLALPVQIGFLPHFAPQISFDLAELIGQFFVHLVLNAAHSGVFVVVQHDFVAIKVLRQACLGVVLAHQAFDAEQPATISIGLEPQAQGLFFFQRGGFIVWIEQQQIGLAAL